MRIEEAKRIYQGERIAFKEIEETVNPEGEVILHNKDRRFFERSSCAWG